MQTTLTCSAIVTACGRKTRRCVGVEGGRVRGDSCGRDGRRGFQRGRSGGLQGFCTVRRTLDSDKRSIQPSFNPLVQSRRDKRNPQKQIRLLRPKTTAETKSQAAVFVCRAGVLQPCRNDKVGGKGIYWRHKIQVLPLLWFKSNPGKRPLNLLRKITCHRETSHLGALKDLGDFWCIHSLRPR